MARGFDVRGMANDMGQAGRDQSQRAFAFARQGSRMDDFYKNQNRGTRGQKYQDPFMAAYNRTQDYNTRNPIAPTQTNVADVSDVADVPQSTAEADAQENRDKIFDLAETGLDEARDNPIDAMILEQLQNRATTDVPYDSKTINQLMTQGTQASAAQFENDQRSLDKMAGRAGVNTSDPAYIAMQRESKERQNKSNTTTRRNVQSDARIENYNAQGRGLSDLGGANTRYRNRIDNRSDNLGGLYGRETFRSGEAETQYQRPAQRNVGGVVDFSAWQNAPHRTPVRAPGLDWGQVGQNSINQHRGR